LRLLLIGLLIVIHSLFLLIYKTYSAGGIYASVRYYTAYHFSHAR